MPVVLSSMVIAVTNMTASRSPLSAGSARQGNMRRSVRSQVRVSPTAAGALNIQPSASGLAKRDAGEGKGEMGHGNSGEQDARQNEGAVAAPAQGEIKRERDGAAGSELGQRGGSIRASNAARA